MNVARRADIIKKLVGKKKIQKRSVADKKRRKRFVYWTLHLVKRSIIKTILENTAAQNDPFA